MPKALVTGASGLLGREIVQSFNKATSPTWEVVGTGLSRANPPLIRKLDVTNSAAFEALLDEEKPDIVVHSAADRSPDSVAASPEAAKALNVTATGSIATATAERGIPLIYISTDYVFAGLKGEAPYAASATTNPPNLYGITKRDGETAVAKACTAGLGVSLRVPVLYGHGRTGESAVNTLVDAVRKAEKGETVKMDHWAQRYPTCTTDVGRVVVDISNTFLEKKGQSLPKILQYSANERFTKYEMACLFAEILGVETKNIIQDFPEEGKGANRPYDTHLSTKELEEIGVAPAAMKFEDWWRRELSAVRH